jgi:hypothetical protein
MTCCHVLTKVCRGFAAMCHTTTTIDTDKIPPDITPGSCPSASVFAVAEAAHVIAHCAVFYYS